MPLPIAAMLIAGGVSFGINALAAYKKGEISKEQYRQAMAASQELERKLKSLRPDETWEDINPQLLSAAAKYSPEIAAFVQEKAPELIKEAQSTTEKQVQRAALQKYSAMAETGRDVISQAQREQALFEADARAKQRQQALMDRMRQQGLLGSGAGLQAQLATEQATAQEARQAALQGVQEAEMRRRQALGQAASLAGQIRGQNLQVESANVGTMNAYNSRLANARNLYNQYAAGQRNQAQQINQQRERETEQYNLGLQNQYALYNRQQREAARERARQYDVDTLKTIHGARQRAEGDRFAGRREFIGDMGSAVTSGLGAGLSAYGMAGGFGGGASAGQNLVNGIARGAANAAGQQMVNSMFQSPVDTTPQYAGPIPAQPYVQNYSQVRNAYIPGAGPLRPAGQREVWDESSESIDLGPYYNLRR